MAAGENQEHHHERESRRALAAHGTDDCRRGGHVDPTTPAARHWSEQLASWGVPREILDRAPQDPWIVPVRLFQVCEQLDAEDSPSHERAREALAPGGSVLDVGCGGGRAAFAAAPPAASVIGVDQRPRMLQEFAATAQTRGLSHREIEGSWPGVADEVPPADVVVCHHVAYNVADLRAFTLALAAHARRRVVLELSRHHPLAYLSPLWERFWGFTRPDGPTAETALDVLHEAGLPARMQLWDDPAPHRESALSPAEQVEIIRIRLCLTPDRDPEIAEAMRELPPRTPRPTATIWWDG
jgi:SAM-dependent methyltransferase